MKLQDVIFVLILALTRCPPNVAKYIVYSLANGQMNDEELTCDSTCHYHGLQCSTTGFDCHAAAVKHCGGKELTLLIRGTCELDLCNVDCELGVYYSSQEHLGVSVCDSGMALVCPRSWTDSLCQCELPAAAEDLYDRDFSVDTSAYRSIGLLAFGVILLTVVGVKLYRKCACGKNSRGDEGEEDDVSFSDSELALLALESNSLGRSGDDDLSASSSDVLLNKKKKVKKTSRREAESDSKKKRGENSNYIAKGKSKDSKKPATERKQKKFADL